jgi:hypothetical protein
MENNARYQSILVFFTILNADALLLLLSKLKGTTWRVMLTFVDIQVLTR